MFTKQTGKTKPQYNGNEKSIAKEERLTNIFKSRSKNERYISRGWPNNVNTLTRSSLYLRSKLAYGVRSVSHAFLDATERID